MDDDTGQLREHLELQIAEHEEWLRLNGPNSEMEAARDEYVRRLHEIDSGDRRDTDR